MRTYLDIEYKSSLFLDLYLPDEKEFSLFLYIHGGGLTSGSRKGVEPFANTLVKNGIGVASIEYRMYPKAKFPDFIDDSAEAVAWVKNNISAYGKLNSLYVGGSSAGGYISQMLCFDSTYLKKYKVNVEDISAFIHDAGQPTSHFNVLREYNIDSKRIIVDRTAPLFFVGMEKSYPPMLFIVSNNDMFNRLEQTELMVNTLRHFGHEKNVKFKIMDGSHCHYVYKLDSDGEGIFAKLIIDFLSTL